MNIMDKAEKLQIETRAFVGGRYVAPQSGDTMKKNSSYNGKSLPEISASDEALVDLAVEKAKEAYREGGWRKLSFYERGRILLRLADLMEECREELALLDTLETNRAFQNYYEDSLPKAIETLRYSAELSDKFYDRAMPPAEGEFSVIHRIPLGVVAVITPWNDPMVVDAWKYSPALLMGNSVIMKPAEQSSLSLIRLAALTKEAGIPDGVFQVLPGRGEVVGKRLGLHPDVNGIFFTGSSEVGKKIVEYAGQSNMKKVGLECGGKSPFLVSEHCRDIPRAAKILAENVFYNQGQICSASSRAIVNEKVYDEFEKCLKQEMEKFVPGNPFDDKNRVGCIVSREQFDKVNDYISMAKEDGGTIYQAAKETKMPEQACYIRPTLIQNLDRSSRVYREEIFGPVVILEKFSDIETAIAWANDTKYGLAAAVFTDDLNEAYSVSNRLEAGLVHVNSWGEDKNITPFGGIKESGIGKDRSVYAFDEYSQLKTTWVTFKRN